MPENPLPQELLALLSSMSAEQRAAALFPSGPPRAAIPSTPSQAVAGTDSGQNTERPEG